MANNSNILLDGATVTMNDSDLEANGNITIKDTSLSSVSTIGEPDNYGIWADGNITIENSNINLEKAILILSVILPSMAVLSIWRIWKLTVGAET